MKMGIDSTVMAVGEVVAATGTGAGYLFDNATDAVINIQRKTSLTLTMAKFSGRVGRALTSSSPICCGLNTASSTCSGLSFCMHGASYLARKNSPDAAFGLYLEAQGFSVVADTLDKIVGGPSLLF